MPANITRKVDVTVQMSAFDMGRAFAELHSHEQAQFFNGIAAETASWEKPACFQWSMMRADLNELPEALKCFREMSEYAE
jgi:hypothetical protein